MVFVSIIDERGLLSSDGAIDDNYANWAKGKMTAFAVVHFFVPYVVMVLTAQQQPCLAHAILVAFIIVGVKVQSSICNRNPLHISAMQQQYSVCGVPITFGLMASLLLVMVSGCLWLQSTSALGVPICVTRLWPIAVMMLVVFVLVLEAKQNSGHFGFQVPTWMVLFFTAIPSIAEMGVDGETAGHPLSSPLLCEQYLGWCLVAILITAQLLQILSARVICNNFDAFKKDHEARSDNYKRLSKLATIMDFSYVRAAMLETAKQLALKAGEPQDKINSFKEELDSERFKTKGIYENLAQIWVTSMVIQASWGVVPQKQTLFQCASVGLSLWKIWDCAPSFWKVQVSGFDTWRVWPGATFWKTMRMLYMALSLFLTAGSLIHIAAIPYCGPHTGFTFSGGCQPATCGNTTVKFNGTLIDADCVPF